MHIRVRILTVAIPLSLAFTAMQPHSAQAECNSVCQQRCAASVARGDSGPQYKSQRACETYWSRRNKNPEAAKNEMNQVNSAARRRQSKQ